ncbi:hypothetical protein SAMN04487948_102247 [Halogranum amylolyticum]|uniref:Uncharacterized protein n=1 Tax=Halogranum amylolyticum TaxID=660520 RepID=A0A1H8PE40_9EURY|nr:hypothetical protein [Halogranum amylolyticum]SEO40096.1 hypothetical protein SAMN04487948_102247 [Halogranum amylolyticum]
MNRSPTRVAVLVLTLCTLTALSLGVVLADGDGQSIVVDDAVETETRTVTLFEENYTVSETARVSAGDEFSVDVRNASTTYVHLYDADGALLVEYPVGVGEPATFATANRSPGEYVLATHDAEGNFDTAKPLVVTAYDTSLSASTASADGEAAETSFTVNATHRADAPAADDVVVVVRGDDGVTRVNASESEGGNYTATTNLAPGEYRAYAELRAGGERVGLSDMTTVTVSDGTGQGSQTDETDEAGGTNGTEATTSERSPTASGDDATGGMAELLPSSLTDGRLAELLNTPALLAGLFLGGLVLSTAVYQLIYSLRR